MLCAAPQHVQTAVIGLHMLRLLAPIVLMSAVTCGPTSSPPTSGAATPSLPLPVKLPSPSVEPNYPPVNLADLVALADRGVSRRFIGAEAQDLHTCTKEWNRVFEPDGTPPEQIASDLMKVAINRKVIFNSCGGYIYGTVDPSFCNCYRGDHGYLVIDRGPNFEPAPGQMLVTFSLRDTDTSPHDWEVIVPAPTA
jgi:hypothetical protein